MEKQTKWITFALVGSMLCACSNHPTQDTGMDKETLGKLIFNDTTLSEPQGQSCATCHDAARGFADKDCRIVSEGAVHGLFSQRNSMSVCYTKYIPPLHYDDVDSTYVGGLFWDGRVNTLQAQAAEPFVNPVEMGMTREKVVERVRQAAYYPEFVKIYGESDIMDSVYAHVTDALAAYQSSDEINPFSSKFDAYLADEYEFTPQEKLGLELFMDVKKGMCAECHVVGEAVLTDKKSLKQEDALFTDFTYDNLGIPRNPKNPHYSVPAQYFLLTSDSLDLGLGPIVKKLEENGKFRVPTLRNIALTPPYGHNGYFETLEDIVHFYNVRDVKPAEYPASEYPATVNTAEMGNLGLTTDEEKAIVAFMQTLTDGFRK